VLSPWIRPQVTRHAAGVLHDVGEDAGAPHRAQFQDSRALIWSDYCKNAGEQADGGSPVHPADEALGPGCPRQ
jgi:hypothetical protein